jgi:hypothetical protein
MFVELPAPLVRGKAIGDRVERRRKTRIWLPFSVRVQGVDAEGGSFVADTVVENLSTAGIYVHLPFRVNEGQELLIVIRLSVSQTGNAVHVEARGPVVRVEPKPHQSFGVALAFIEYACA